MTQHGFPRHEGVIVPLSSTDRYAQQSCTSNPGFRHTTNGSQPSCLCRAGTLPVVDPVQCNCAHHTIHPVRNSCSASPANPAVIIPITQRLHPPKQAQTLSHYAHRNCDVQQSHLLLVIGCICRLPCISCRDMDQMTSPAVSLATPDCYHIRALRHAAFISLEHTKTATCNKLFSVLHNRPSRRREMLPRCIA